LIFITTQNENSTPPDRRMLTYTQVLFLFVVPPAFGLAFLARPFVSKVDLVRLVCLVVVAFLYSTPWCPPFVLHGCCCC